MARFDRDGGWGTWRMHGAYFSLSLSLSVSLAADNWRVAIAAQTTSTCSSGSGLWLIDHAPRAERPFLLAHAANATRPQDRLGWCCLLPLLQTPRFLCCVGILFMDYLWIL